MTNEAYIAGLKLRAHPEGGYFREYYRSSEMLTREVLPARYEGDRNFATSIYFLITPASPSRLHSLLSDEIWTFVAGEAATMHLFGDDEYSVVNLGSNISGGEELTVAIKAGTHFAAEVKEGFALFTCFVAPGFDFADFEFSRQEALNSKFPEEKEIISRLSKKQCH